jgi:hypothetical protein
VEVEAGGHRRGGLHLALAVLAAQNGFPKNRPAPNSHAEGGDIDRHHRGVPDRQWRTQDTLAQDLLEFLHGGYQEALSRVNHEGKSVHFRLLVVQNYAKMSGFSRVYGKGHSLKSNNMPDLPLLSI